MKFLLLVACIATTNIEALKYEIQKVCPAANAEKGHMAGVSLMGDEHSAVWTWQYDVDMTGWEVGGTELAAASGRLAVSTFETVRQKVGMQSLEVRLVDLNGSPVCDFHFEMEAAHYSKSGKCVMYVEQAR